MLDVLIVVSSDPRYDSRSRRYLSSLLDAGFKAKLVGISTDGKVNEADGIVCLPVMPGSGKKFFLRFYRKLIPFVREMNSRIILAGDLFSLPVAVINKRRFSTRERPTYLIYDSKELYQDLPSIRKKKTSSIFWGLVEKSAFRYVDRSMAVNQSIAAILGAKWHTKPTVVMNVPEPGKAVKIVEKQFNRIQLVYSGGLQPGRGLFNLIRLLSLLPEKYELKFLGEGQLRTDLEHLSSTLKVSERVHFVGQVETHRVIGELSNAHVGLCLIENAGLSYFHSLPNKLFQYVGAGLPVLASDFPDMGDIIRKFRIGQVVDPTDIEAAAARVIEMTSDKGNYLQLTQNCIEAAKILNWEIEKEKFLTLVRSLI